MAFLLCQCKSSLLLTMHWEENQDGNLSHGGTDTLVYARVQAATWVTRVVILAPVKYLHNNCGRIAFRSQIKSLWTRAYVMNASGATKTTTTMKWVYRPAVPRRLGCRQFNSLGACRAFESLPDIIGGLAMYVSMAATSGCCADV